MLDYPQVALDFMNRDHAEFIGLRQRLLELLTTTPEPAMVDALLEELLAHTRTHFAEEERLMQEKLFPPYLMHKHEHERVLTGMQIHIKDWQDKRNAQALADWLQQDVGDWFTNHVSTMDFVTAAFLQAQGAK